MTKAKTSKKKNIKLRRQVRKTVGAIFMASAIVIAAIPVQGIEAETLQADTVTNDTRKNIDYDGNITYTPGTGNSAGNSSEDIHYDMEDKLKIPDDSQIKTSHYVREIGGRWSLNWQFEYYIVDVMENKYAIISKYNNTFSERNVLLSSYANDEYYIVEDDSYNDFYDVTKTPKTAGTQEHFFTYADYENYRNNGDGAITSDMRWIQQYRQEAYDGFIERCKDYADYLEEKAAYDLALDDYNMRHDAWIAGGSQGQEPQPPAAIRPEPSKPSQISFMPATDFSDAEKYKFYCDNDSNISGKGDFTLVEAIDNRKGKPGTGTVFLIKTDTPNEYTDASGFMIGKNSAAVLGIAERAFEGIVNVDTMTMPEDLKYIGDEAFMGSFIKGINLNNVENIGNRAFKNCSDLKDVAMSYTSKIGCESFYNTAISSITFPSLLSEIGYGAFAQCRNLESVDFSQVSTECKVDDYAFFNAPALSSVDMENSGVVSLGEGAFALTSTPTGAFKDVRLPNRITGKGDSELGDLLFAGRTTLETVKFPDNYGTDPSATINIPSAMFRNCANLRCVDFTARRGSNINGYVGYDVSGTSPEATYNLLYLDVTNPDFIVKGPERNLAGGTAYPRMSTWKAFTRVSNFVPYNYVDAQGIDCYEVSDGKYLLQANANGELTSCVLINRDDGYPIDIVIPEKVGNYPIKSIRNGCFSDENIRVAIRSITIQDNSIEKLDGEVFANLPNLEWAVIGNSVQSIGDRAFYHCSKLVDVTFHTPAVGHDKFTIGSEAFKTESNELTFHGDIVPGYAPFEFATGKDTSQIDEWGKRICYKSLSPDFLTVMYDNKTENVTLLDYPRYNDLDELHADYCKDMEDYYYWKYGGRTGEWTEIEDNDGNVTGRVYSEDNPYYAQRKEFAEKWANAADDDARNALYYDLSYGPWIDADFQSKFLEGAYLEGRDMTGIPTPLEFYTKNPYSIIANYERGSAARGEYEAVTDEEMRWINTCLNLVIPAGVTSIDATEFFNATENTRSVSAYFDRNSKNYKMCTQSGDGVIPGLFSGFYDDYEGENDFETEEKGNDRILSITMADVKYLPDYAFDSCERLQNVSLGAACAEMGTAPFRGCDSMTDIAGNDYFEVENRIIYSVNDDDTYTIKECLPSRGKTGSSSIIISSTDPKITNVSAIEDGAFEDCDYIVKVFLDDAEKLKIISKNCFNECDKLNEVGLPSSVNRIEEKAFGGNELIEVTIPGKEVHIVKDAFEHVPTNTINTYKGTSADDYGKYYDLTVEYLSDLFTVRFYDDDGTLLKEQKDIVAHQNATPPDAPVKEGYTFTGWQPDYHDITANLVVIAQYSDNSGSANRHTVTFYADDGKTVVSRQEVDHNGSAVAPMPPSKTGYTFVAWAGNYTEVTKDETVVATYTPNTATSPGPGSSSSPGTSASPTATPANGGSGNEVKKYRVTVSGGSGTGDYPAGAVVAINAYDMGVGQNFDKWTTSTAGVGFADATARSTTFTMPASNVSITATYKIGSSGSSGSGSGSGSGAGSGSGTTGGTANNGTIVDISRPGISNTNLAGATVSGATDNFIVKITEDQAATDAATAALQARYGDLSRIKYLPMDISLYDSTGRIKIADTTGISVNLTLPLPDALVQYAGNNRVAAITNGQLEDLNMSFTTIDGVPCVNFTATHFSPYVIYVDTANLTEATIDSTPKTGDPIHPKWFLALGLACTSLILFFKRDKVVLNTKNA